MYVKVILPLKLLWEPCYRTSDAEVEAGMRVGVKFAGKRYIGVVSETDVQPDVDEKKIKDIDSIERHLPAIGKKELELWHFMSDYYICSMGEVYRLAYPSTKTAGEESAANAEIRKERKLQSEREKLEARISKLTERLRRKEKELEGKHNDSVMERLREEYGKLLTAIDEAKEMLCGIEKADVCVPAGKSSAPAGSQSGAWRKTRTAAGPSQENLELENAFRNFRTVLVHGGDERFASITYAVARTLDSGKDVLLTVPEISLSNELQERFTSEFGSAVHIFHSGESAARRREIASLMRNSSGDRAPMLILGTRSALFLPFTKLGLIVVEEEHDTAYKNDSVPRFNGRDTAVMMGTIHDAKVLLSSPTPSLESLYNAGCGRYAEIRTGFTRGEMEIIDTTVERRKNGMIGDLSRILIQNIGDTLSEGGKVLILRPWGPMDDIRETLAGRWPEAVASGSLTAETSYDARRMDISGTSLLAFIGSDILLDRNDFRADERAMQALDLFRNRFTGRMIVQTRQSAHQLFCSDGKLSDMLMEERRIVNYPPFSRMVDIIMRDTNIPRLEKLSHDLSGLLSGFNPMGPFTPSKGRTPVEDTRIIRIILGKAAGIREEKKKIAGAVGDFESSRKYTGHISIDVDPL